MPLNSFITLGRSGLRVSPFCLGSMTFGEDFGWGASVADSETMIAAYLERGGNFIDTANIYTNGHSEKIIGDFFAHGRGNRHRVVIGTKFFGNLFEGDPNGGGAGRKAHRTGRTLRYHFGAVALARYRRLLGRSSLDSAAHNERPFFLAPRSRTRLHRWHCHPAGLGWRQDQAGPGLH
jgi:aryl-alcohol dehydrogenase-like predicted oxidoreductase